MRHFTYILKSLKDGRRYIGSTSNLLKRVAAHNAGLTLATKNRRPFEILCVKEFDSYDEARKYELYLKKFKGGNQLYTEIEAMKNCAVVAQLVEQLHGKE